MDLPLPPETIRRIIYFGTPDVAVAPLQALHAAGYEIPLVISAPDKRRGRGSALQPSPVKAAALELGLRVSDHIDDVFDTEADLGVVVAYGALLRAPVLERLPLVNLHFSLLPRWRGAAPVERALLAGDHETGVGLMQIVEALDAGGLYRERRLEIGPDATLHSLRADLVELGIEALLDALRHGFGDPQPQIGEPVYAHKIRAEEYRIDWSAPASSIDRLIRLGGAWTTFRSKRFKIHAMSSVGTEDTVRSGGTATASVLAPGEIDGLVVGTGAGHIVLERVQPEGKPAMAARDWRNGAQPGPGERFE